jgi:CpeT/CpcT family (DUF1001)
MRLFNLFPFAVSLLTGCGSEPQTTEDSGPTSIAVEDRLADWLAGDFDSADQADEDPQYYAISMRLCPVALPDLGERVLYIEQAASDDLASPYRQRLYVVDRIDEDTAVSRVYEATRSSTETALVGLCDAPDSQQLAAADFELKEGCDVSLTWDGTQFSGGTEGEGCESSLGGASYATSSVTLDATALSSWDQGWSEDGAQVWGATAGPYVFLRRTAAPVVD